MIFILKLHFKIFFNKCFLPCCLLSVILSVCSFLACTSDVANGTGSNAGEAEMAFAFSNVSGEPLSFAKVNIWKMEDGRFVLVDSSQADTSGLWKSLFSTKQEYLLEASFADSLAYIHWIDFSKKVTDSLTLYPTETLEGFLMQNQKPLAGASLKVLNRTSQTDDHGAYSLNQMPRGNHLMMINETKMVQIHTNDRDTIDLDTPFLLIENFEDWGLKTIIGRLFGGGWWYFSSDMGVGGSSFIEPSIESGPEAIAVTEDAYFGRSMHVKMNVDTSMKEKFALVGFSLGEDFYKEQGKSFFDISNLSAVTFRAKGYGSLFLQWVKKEEGDSAKAFSSVSFTLSENWNAYRIPLDLFDGSFQLVNALNFMAEEDAELWLDDICFEGIDLNMWETITK